jgi:membrane protease YdiL (CAAX protease family)
MEDAAFLQSRPTKIASQIGTAGPASLSKQRDFFEVSSIFALLLLVLWTPMPWQLPLWGIALAGMLALTRSRFDGLEPMGLCIGNFRPALWAVGLAFVLAVAAVALAVDLRTLQVPASPIRFVAHYGAYAIWAFVQQIGLQCFFLSRLLRLMPDTLSAVSVAAGMFAIAHLPSPILVVAALIWGFVACMLFLRYRNLYLLAISHAILGIAIGITIPPQLDHEMLVGRRYVTYTESTQKTENTLRPQPAPSLSQP